MNGGSVIELNETERRLAEYLSKARQAFDCGRGISDLRQDESRGSHEIALEGIGGELAYCKLMNVYPDLRHDSPWECVDAVIDGTMRVDVKTTGNESGKLYVYGGKESGRVDYFALMVGKFPRYRYAGRIGSDDMLQGWRLKEVVAGRRKCYVAGQDELWE